VELLRQVRADERLKKLPVLMLTAEAKREQIVEARRPVSAAMSSSRSLRLLSRRRSTRSSPSSLPPQPDRGFMDTSSLHAAITGPG